MASPVGISRAGRVADLLSKLTHPVEDLNLIEQRTAPIPTLLQTMIGVGKLQQGDTRASRCRLLPLGVAGPTDKHGGLTRLPNRGDDRSVSEQRGQPDTRQAILNRPGQSQRPQGLGDDEHRSVGVRLAQGSIGPTAHVRRLSFASQPVLIPPDAKDRPTVLSQERRWPVHERSSQATMSARKEDCCTQRVIWLRPPRINAHNPIEPLTERPR